MHVSRWLTLWWCGVSLAAATATAPEPRTSGTGVVTITNTSQVYSGQPLPVTVSTVPSGLSYVVTYNGSSTVPSAVGTYTVQVTITSANYPGSGSATETISANSGGTTTTTTAAAGSGTTTTGGTTSAAASSSSSPCGLGGAGSAVLLGILAWRRGRRRL